MFCTKCGKNNADEAAFCTSCGAPMQKSAGASAQQNTNTNENHAAYGDTQQASNEQYQPPLTPLTPKKPHSSAATVAAILAVILALVLVGVGVLIFLYSTDRLDFTTSSKTTKIETEDDAEESDESPSVRDDDSDDDYDDDDDDADDDDDDDDELYNSMLTDEENAVAIVNDCVERLHQNDAWTEICNMDYIMKSDGESQAFETTLMSYVKDYDPDDLSSLRISGSGQIKLEDSDVLQEWSFSYKDGKTTYNYTKPGNSSTTVELDPSLFSAELDADMLSHVRLSDGKISYTISSDDAMNCLDVLQDTTDISLGVDEISYSDIKVVFCYNEDSMLPESYKLEFSTDISTQGVEATIDYTIIYSFLL